MSERHHWDDEEPSIDLQAEVRRDAVARHIEPGMHTCGNPSCQRATDKLHNDRCRACYQYRYRNGVEWPEGLTPTRKRGGSPVYIPNQAKESDMAKSPKVYASATFRPTEDDYFRIRKARGGVTWEITGVRVTDKGSERFVLEPDDVLAVIEGKVSSFVQEAQRRAA